MINRGIKPENIAMITFTNKAAREMRERIRGLAKNYARQDGGILTSTFHSLGAQILREYAEHFGRFKNFTIYDQTDSKSLVKQICEMLAGQAGGSIENEEIARYSHKIASLKDSLISLDVLTGAKPPMEEVSHADLQSAFEAASDSSLLEVFEAYEQALLKANAFDFGDLILKFAELLTDKPDVAHKLKNRWHHIMVDEYQDTNRAQYAILKRLAGPDDNLCVVGDDAQSIYGWRGADINNIYDFQKDYPRHRLIKLTTNYRSTGAILDAANKLIAHNVGQIPKNLTPVKSEGEEPSLLLMLNPRQEAEYVSDMIFDQINAGASPDEIAVLYRSHFISREFERALRERGIPYQVAGGVGFYEREEIKDLLAYLRLAHNPQDTLALQRALKTPSRGIGPSRQEAIIEHARQSHGGNLVKACANPPFGGKAGQAAKDFAALLSFNQEETVNEILAKIVSGGYRAWWEERLQKASYADKEQIHNRLQNIDELLNDTYEFSFNEGGGDLGDYLERVSLNTSGVEAEDNEHVARVTLSTIHAAKGLEFECVFMVGLNQGIFPANYAINEGRMPEERRLAYVAITRAKEKLFMTAPLTRPKRGQRPGELRPEQRDPSQFIAEAGIEKVDCNIA